MLPGKTATVTVSGLIAGDKVTSWTSSNNTVASVSNGKITAKAAGTAYITVKLASGLTGTVKVTVVQPTITLSSTNISLDPGITQKISVSGLASGDSVANWKSANTAVATVDASGTIKGVNPGNTTVTVTLSSGLTANVYVTVNAISKKAPVITAVYNSVRGGDIRWNKVNGAVGYVVYRHRQAEGTKKVATINNVNTVQCYDTSIQYNCFGRVYVYYVKALYKENGKTVEGPASDRLTLQRLAPVQIDSASNYRNNAVGLQYSCVVNENKALGYQIQYATSKSDLFDRTGSFKTITVSGRNSLKQTISNLEKGKTYWFRVRAYVDYTHSVTKVHTRTWSQYCNPVSVTINR